MKLRILRYSITTLLLLTAIVAIVICFWPTPQGIQSHKEFESNGDQSNAEFVWYDNAAGMVELSYASTESLAWTPSETIPGDSSVVSLKWAWYGKYHTGSTGTEIKIQLPKSIRRWQSFDLKLPETKRENYPTPSLMGGERSLMKPTEVAIVCFSSHSHETFQESESSVVGRLKILGVTDTTVTIELHFPNIEIHEMDYQPQIFTLERRFQDAE